MLNLAGLAITSIIMLVVALADVSFLLLIFVKFQVNQGGICSRVVGVCLSVQRDLWLVMHSSFSGLLYCSNEFKNC